MGYDMYTVQEADADEKAAIEAADAHRRGLISPHTLPEGSDERAAAEKAWADAWAASDAAHKSYFRLNVWGMSVCVELMEKAGMVTSQGKLLWPELSNYGLTEYPDDPEYYDGHERAEIEAKLTEQGRAFLQASKAVIEYEPQPVAGIPAHKFWSNDGWLVTPKQCEAALSAWEAAAPELRASIEAEREWWPGWIEFLTHSKDRGGFRVH